MVIIDKTNGDPAYRQIYKQIRSNIEANELTAGDQLPAIRELAHRLGVARNTVEAAYRQLSLEGYARGKRGVGYTVEDLDFSVLDDDGSSSEGAEETIPPPHLGMNPLGDSHGCTYDFSYGNRTPGALPSALLRAFSNEALSSDNMDAAASYMDPFGLPELRILLAQQLAESRDVHCSPEQIVLQPGTQPAIRNIIDLFENPHLRVAMEDPGYDGARSAFEVRRCDVVPIPTHRNTETFVEFLKASKADVAFVTPSNQFPLGFIMPLATRLQIIGWAHDTDSYIIEDDYCCEYRYGSSPVPSLHSLDPDHVIYLGTMSKILTPAIRLSYVVLPWPFVTRWRKVYSREFCPLPWLSQEILRRFMAKGYWDRYVHATVNLYRKRHDILIDAIDTCMGDRVKVFGANAGLHILVGDKERRNQYELIDSAQAHDVRVYETNPYWMNKSHAMGNYVLVGFSAIEDDQIPQGIARLRQAWYG